MMNPWVKRKWVRALRGGEYKKGKYRLNSPNYGGYCCLGVLVEEMAPEFIRRNEDGEMYVGGKHADDNFDPNRTTEEFITDDLAILYGLSLTDQDMLSSKNDGADTFEPVIAYIEENL